MLKHTAKITAATLILLMSLNACGTDDTTLIQTINPDSASSLAKLPDTKPAAMMPEILSQITSSKLDETEFGVNVKTLPVVKNKKKVTILSYLAFDNDKGGWRDELRQIINFHELSGSSPSMNVILQTDTLAYQDSKRYFIVGDSNSSKIVSPYTSFKYERDSSDYRVMKSFIKWGFSNYPSQIKMLDIDSHGMAFKGVTVDQSSGYTTMSLPNMVKAIEEGAGKVDLLNFDACLMGSIEVVYEVKDIADIVVGSQDSTFGTGMLYTKAMPSIIANSKTPEEIGKNIILASDRQGKDFLRRPNKKGIVPNVFTISAYKTSATVNLISEMNNLSKLFLKDMNRLKPALKSALDGTHPMNIAGDSTDLVGQRDLYEVLSRINTTVTDSNIKTAIEKTRTALNKTIILSRTHNSQKHAQGMAINISPISIKSESYKATAFAKNTQWDEFITAVNN